MRTYYMEWTVDRGEESIDICLDYVVTSWGCPAHYGSLTYPGHPAEGPEIEIEAVWLKSDENNLNAPPFKLTDDEYEKIELHILENPPEPDYPEDF